MSLKKHLFHLSETIGPRLIGTAGNLRAREYISGFLGDLGCAVNTQEFRRTISIPERGYVQVVGDTSQSDCWPCLGTPAFGPERCSVKSLGVGRPADWEHSDIAGQAALCRRGELHDSVKVELAARKGATAVLFYVDFEDCLYSTRASSRVASIPAAVIRPSLARRLAHSANNTIELRIAASLTDAECANIWCDLGTPERDFTVLCAHYDSRPFTPGANDNAAGAACLLELVRRLSSMPLRHRYRCIFFDGEETVTAGSKAYVAGYGVRGIHSVINIDAVGFGRPKALLGDRDGPLSIELADWARQSAARHGLELGTASSKTGISDHAPFRNAGVTDCLWISDHPNPGRETDLDIPSRIDTEHLETLVSVLVDLVESPVAR